MEYNLVYHAISRKRKGADDDSDDEKTPFMLNKRAQAERAAREAAKKAEAAAEKYDKLSGKILDFMVEKCSKCGLVDGVANPVNIHGLIKGGH